MSRIPRIYFWSQKPQVEYAIKKFKRQRDLMGLASAFAVMGTLYGVIKKHQIELDYYLQAFTIFDEIQNDELKATLCQPIASIYEYLKEFPLAQHYYELGLELSQKRNILELISEYHRILGEFYENHGMEEKTESYYTELDRLAKLKREILDDLELHDPCILCGDKGVEVNLISIPYLLPSYLPKSGCVHLDCLQIEVKNHLPSKASSKVYIMFLIIFFIGWYLGGVWFSWTDLWYYFLIPVLIAVLIILLIGFRKFFTRSYWVWRWINKQQEIRNAKN